MISLQKICLAFFCSLPLILGAQADLYLPNQPIEGPGGSTYRHESVTIHDFADKADGYWLYEPAAPRPAEAPVIVFMHGYGAYNPMIYGAWIKHLVRKGNVVIFPRYQKNLTSPSPKHFVRNTQKGIHDALVRLDTGQHVRPLVDHLSIIGHSYGGVIAANLAVNATDLELPPVDALMLCAPGTGPFKGGLLKNYEEMPAKVKLLILVNDRDRVVGDRIGKRIFRTATQVKNRNLLHQFKDKRDGVGLSAGHNECYAPDEDFDSGVRNVSTRRALRVGKTNALDYYGYWKLADALLEFARADQYAEFAFGDTAEQRFLGYWSDGKPVRPLAVELPPGQPMATRQAGVKKR